MVQTEIQICLNCGKPLSPDSPGGTCPRCLMALAMNNVADSPTNAADGGLARDRCIPNVEQLVSKFPNLEIQHLIGHGGMGAVYQARQVNLDRMVALKILSPRLGHDPAFAERFLREARTLAKLSHPNIVTVFDFGQVDEFYYLIMEFVDGVNLRDTISAKLLTPSESLEIIPQICDALQFAHDKGVIHRDIKPENILVTRDGKIKIADFGLAKMLQPDANDFTLTGTHQLLGTLNYMAPEQIEKPDVVDHRADLYSLGVVFYELLTGELPIGRFDLPSRMSSSVPRQLDDLVMRTLEKDPARRYQQASQIKTACASIDPHSDMEQDPFAPGETADRWSSALPLGPAFPVTINDVYAGFATGFGLMRAFETHLELEFEIRDFMDALKSSARKIQIPLERIASVRLNRGWFSNSIEIQTDQIESVQNIPTSKHGAFKVYLKNSALAAAESTVFGMNQILAKTRREYVAPQPPRKRRPGGRQHSNGNLLRFLLLVFGLLVCVVGGLAIILALLLSVVRGEPAIAPSIPAEKTIVQPAQDVGLPPIQPPNR